MTKDSDKLDKLILDGAIIKEQLHGVREDINRLNKNIYIGNGTPSLMTRVTVNEDAVNDLKWWKRMAIVGATTGVFGFVMAVFERLM